MCRREEVGADQTGGTAPGKRKSRAGGKSLGNEARSWRYARFWIASLRERERPLYGSGATTVHNSPPHMDSRVIPVPFTSHGPCHATLVAGKCSAAGPGLVCNATQRSLQHASRQSPTKQACEPAPLEPTEYGARTSVCRCCVYPKLPSRRHSACPGRRRSPNLGCRRRCSEAQPR